MKLERLILENFRQYYGRQRVEFSKDTTRHVTVVHGVNGAGKTSLFLALNWCLYGKEVIDNVGDLLSKEAMKQTQRGEMVKTSVELAFSHNGHRYVMRRTMSAVRQIDDKIEPYDFEDVIMKRISATGEAENERSPQATINAILPANVRTYFLFDGEKIDHFAKPEAANEVKDAIYLILRLEVLDRARKHLKETATRYRKELVQVSGDAALSELERQVRQQEIILKQAENRFAELQVFIASAQKIVNEIDQDLSEMVEVSQLQQERKQLEANLKVARREQETVIEEIQTNVSNAYLLVAKPIVGEALKVLDDKRKKGQIPSNIRQQFVQDLLDRLECICGRPFIEHSPEYQKLLGLLKDSVSSSLENDVLEINNALRIFQVNGDNRGKEIQRLMRQRTEIVDRISAMEARLSDLHIQLKDSPLEDVSKLEKKRAAFRADVDSFLLESGSMTERTDEATKRIEKLTNDIRKAKKNSDRARHLEQKLGLAQQGAKAIDETYQSFADDMRQQIEAETNKIFKTLIWKDSHFQQVSLGEDFNLEVIDRYGLPARPELSAGERQVLSLSFIAAMSQVSGEEAPLVMDTPFGRLSSQHRNSITTNLPGLTSQMILLVTDEELRDEARRNINPYIGAEYRLVFDDQTSCTEIQEL